MEKIESKKEKTNLTQKVISQESGKKPLEAAV